MGSKEDEARNVETWMFRYPGERFSLFVCIVLTLIVGAIFSYLNIFVVVGLAVMALIYVRLNQAQYMGNAIRVHTSQFPELWDIFKDHAERLEIGKGSLFIKQDPSLNAYTLGVNYCTVILTSALVEQLTTEELSFVIGHELGHFKANHTKISTLINPLGGGNVFADLIFGFWSRKTEYSCDRCGLILTKDFNSALSSMIKLSLGGKLINKFDMDGYLEQVRKADSSSVMMGEWLIDHPLTTNRVKKLYTFWRESFKQKHEV
jgi:Zn-dependent protease with chaperone function